MLYTKFKCPGSSVITNQHNERSDLQSWRWVNVMLENKFPLLFYLFIVHVSNSSTPRSSSFSVIIKFIRESCLLIPSPGLTHWLPQMKLLFYWSLPWFPICNTNQLPCLSLWSLLCCVALLIFNLLMETEYRMMSVTLKEMSNMVKRLVSLVSISIHF